MKEIYYYYTSKSEIMATTTHLLSVSKLYCKTFGHNYEVSKRVTEHVKEYTCTRCKHQLTTNSNGKLIELTPNFQEVNQNLDRIYKNRLKRIKKQLPKIAAAY